MNPEFVLILGCFGLGLVISVAIWLVLSDPLRRLEQSAISQESESRQRIPLEKSPAPFDDRGASKINALILEFEDSWRTGEPSLDGYWRRLGSPKSFSLLTMLIEVNLRNRFRRGQRPSVAQYLELYPKLALSPDRVVSLVYEEYSLLEKWGENPDAARFCERYPPWRDLILPRLKDGPGGRQESLQPAGASD